MDDDKLKQELFYMVRLTSKYDFTRMEVVESILRLENERRILDSVFGRRFKARIFDIAAGVDTDGNCVICGQPADNHVICNHCIESISGSEYAKSKIKIKEKPKRKFNWKRVGQIAVIVCLSMILFIQIFVLCLFLSIPDINVMEEPVVSQYDLVPVTSAEEAQKQLALDFPEEEGYTITYGRKDSDYVGRFLLEKGDCCLEVEENLSEEQRYDYFFKEDVYVFYISLNEEYTSKVGVAEVNSAGGILVMGSFNDGRRTDSYYKYR